MLRLRIEQVYHLHLMVTVAEKLYVVKSAKIIIIKVSESRIKDWDLYFKATTLSLNAHS